jgi:hypothetical protein
MTARGLYRNRTLIVVSRVAREAMEVAGQACAVSMFELASPGRSRAQVAFARQISMYLCHVVGRLSLSEVSIAFERDRSTVAYACHAIEDRRDSPIFDGQIEALETKLRVRIQALNERPPVRVVARLRDAGPERRSAR